jgi:anti-sigma regulatory factor (Ser/Thr protein kinase)
MDTEAEPFDFTFDQPDLGAGSGLRRAFAHSFAWLGDATADAELVLSELYANAVIHGAPPIRVRADSADDGVQVEVDDGTTQFGDPRPDSHGLRLVAKLARDWGVRTSAFGKTVWADIAARPSAG